jgi:hypothetical protein
MSTAVAAKGHRGAPFIARPANTDHTSNKKRAEGQPSAPESLKGLS